MPLTLAIVGFGRLAQSYYAPALKLLEPDARYLIVDPVLQSRERAQEIFPEAKCFCGIDGLSETSIDAVLIASPPKTHFPIWCSLASANVPIFMEKPFPLPHELPLLESLHHDSPPTVINFNRRFWPPYQRLLGLVSAGTIGATHTASLQLVIDDLSWNSVTNHRTMADEGGVLQDLGGHVVDLACGFFDSFPTEVSAAQSQGPDADCVALTFRWPDGRSASCVVGYGRSARETILLVGSAGRLSMDNPHGRVWSGERTGSTLRWGARIVDLLLCLTYALRPARSLTRWSTLAALGAFLRGIRTGEFIGPGLDEAVRVAKLLAAAEKSLITGSTIKLLSFELSGSAPP
jgi:predicted dehydrogenase